MARTRKLTQAQAEDVRVAYQAAVDLSIANAQGVWEIYNAMLLANTILITASTLVLTTDADIKYLSPVLSVVGAFIVASWFLLVRRARRYADYFVLSARELEELYLHPHVDLLSRGGRFADGEPVHLILHQHEGIVSMDKWSRRGQVARTSTFVIGVFGITYLAIFVASLFVLIGA